MRGKEIEMKYLSDNQSESALMNLKPNKRKLIKFLIPSLVVILIITFSFGISAAKKKFHDGPEGFIMGRLTENLNLNETQKAQLEKIREQIREKMESKKQDRESGMKEFENEFLKENIDRSKLIELSKKKETEMQEMKEFMIDRMIEFHNILTPEQRAKAVENLKEMKDKFRHRPDRDKDKPNKDKKDLREDNKN